MDWLFFFIGGILGTKLIILSSHARAGLIIETVHADRMVMALLFIALLIADVLVQSRVAKMKRETTSRELNRLSDCPK